MSKKKRKPSLKTKISTPKEGVSSSPSPRFSSPTFELVRFDLKTWLFIGINTLLFFLFVALKLHNSSIGTWNYMASDGGDTQRGILAGTPRPVRSDEWQVYASFVLAQYEKGFPVENKSLGSGKTPLAFSLPTKNTVSLVKPAFWGYYLLDIERGFSWQWNFKIFPFLIATFLLFMLLTGNHFLISVTGSLWLLLSSAIQWWSIYTELFTYGVLCIVSLIYMTFGTRWLHILMGGLILVLSAFSYAMVLYPAYQVPLAYGLLAILVGFFLQYRKEFILRIRQQIVWKALTLGVSLAGVMFLLILFYTETKDTIAVMMNTVYPGRRMETGGDFSFLRIFADNFNWFMNEQKFPASWANICESSAFLMLSLIPTCLLIVDFFRQRKADLLLICLLAFQALMMIWIFIGFPVFLAKWSFLSVSPSFRSFFIFGFFNVLLTTVIISRHRFSFITGKVWTQMTSFAVLLLLTFLFHQALNTSSGIFFSGKQVWVATMIFSTLTWLVLHFQLGKVYKLSFIILLGIVLVPNLKINPLAQGLSSYFDNKIFKTVSDIKKKDPEARWIVYGNTTTPNFVKATGVDCFNGVQFTPPFDDLHILDPQMKYDSVYNRFAHIGFTALIQPNDSLEFALKQNDLYMIRMDPCSPRLTKMGIKYVIFTYEPNPFELTCMTPVALLPNHYIYERHDL